LNTPAEFIPPPLLATYRIQLSPGFGFDEAAAVVDSIAALGVSHLYLPPVLEARPGSTHGYDQTDTTRLRAELGGEPAFERLIDAAHAAGLGVMLDVVPNHMAAHHDNPWWFGLLRDGPGSPSDRCFDVAWTQGDEKIVLPVLGAPLKEVIERGELAVVPSPDGGLRVRYFDKFFPVRTDDPALSADTESLSGAALAELLSRQHYELAFWRDGLERINYRRFFDIAELAGLRVEDPMVFEQSHAKLLDLVSRGLIDCVRVDHIDGLRDPLQYLHRLRAALDAAAPSGRAVPVFVEKILAHGEEIPRDWPVDGATGYEFLAAAASLMVRPAGLKALREHAVSTGAGVADFAALAVACKEEAARTVLAPELNRLCRAAAAALADHDAAADGGELSSAALARPMSALSARLGVYRTYADEQGVAASDAARIRRAADAAGATSSIEADTVDNAGAADKHDKALLASLADLLTLSGPFESGAARDAALNVILLWQQFTGPLAAKGIEDTALYRDVACLALNDVGTEPIAHEPRSLIDALTKERVRRPLCLNTTDTHDAKRSEDVRARLAALSHDPAPWTTLLSEALPLLAPPGGGPGPTPRDLSLLFHSALALWPADDAPDARLGERLKAYSLKGAREAKLSTSWTNPVAAYESALEAAVERLLTSPDLADVRRRLGECARASRPLAARLSTASLILKLLFPGVPDVYQGTELRALFLVDPDNRGPVDFAARARLLAEIKRRWKADPAAASTELLENHDSDAAKLFVTWRVLEIRRKLLARHAASPENPISLEAFSITRDGLRFTVAAGSRRCTASIQFSPFKPTPNAAADAEAAHENELLAPGRRSGRSGWASIVGDLA